MKQWFFWLMLFAQLLTAAMGGALLIMGSLLSRRFDILLGLVYFFVAFDVVILLLNNVKVTFSD